MKTWTRGALMLALAGCASSSEIREDATPAELQTFVPAMRQAWLGQDAAAFQPLYSEGITIVTVNDRYTGWNEVQARWLSQLPNIKNFTTSHHRFTRSGKGTEITESGRYSYDTTEDGRTMKRTGTYAQVWQLQQDGSYKVLLLNLQ